MLAVLVACEKEKSTDLGTTTPVPDPSDIDSIPSPSLFNDSTFQSFPIANAEWYVFGEHAEPYNLLFFFVDTFKLLPPVTISTRTILQSQFDTAHALAATPKVYFPIITKGTRTDIYYDHIENTEISHTSYHHSYSDSVIKTYFRVDIYDNAVYEKFNFNGTTYEAKVMDFDMAVSDTIKYLKRGFDYPPPYGGHYIHDGTYTVITIDNVPFNGKQLKKYRIRRIQAQEETTYTQGADPLFFYSSWSFPGDQYKRFIYNGDTLNNY